MDLEKQYDNIYRYCYQRVRQREMAEDITQETFLRFYESKSYVNMGKPMRYLYAIARNLCIDAYRRQKALLSPKQENVDEDWTTVVAVRIALSQLSEEDRELLLLRYVNGEPVSVISGFLGMSRFAVYRRLLQAQRQFKTKLGKENAE